MAQVKVLKSPACSRCAQAMALLLKIRGDYPDLSTEEVDITVHPEEVLKYQPMASPGIVINYKLEFVGVPKEGDLRQILAHA